MNDEAAAVSLHGDCALVTGAASGIGAATARTLHAHGATVWLTDVDEAGARALADQLGERAHAAHLDVTSEPNWVQVEELIQAAGQRLSILVNSAGAASKSGIARTPVAELRRLLDLNLVGTFLALQLAARAMTHGGSVITISSLRGVLATAELGAYGASKFGVRALSRVAALEFAEAGIRVNTVCPGSIITPITDRPDFADDDLDAYVRSIPLGRRGSAEEVARVILFLAGPDSSYVTGVDLLVDGGTGAGGSTPKRRPLDTGRPANVTGPGL
jgi:NAD(P)-dependent dehydrogenase (short-subunit alcohol dehydrogenase family)